MTTLNQENNDETLSYPSLVVPTVAGLPLTLDFDATGSADLTMSGKFDVRKLGSSPRSMDVHGEIRPRCVLIRLLVNVFFILCSSLYMYFYFLQITKRLSFGKEIFVRV